MNDDIDGSFITSGMINALGVNPSYLNPYNSFVSNKSPEEIIRDLGGLSLGGVPRFELTKPSNLKLSEEENIKRLNDFIKENHIEKDNEFDSDDKYIFLFKPTDLDGNEINRYNSNSDFKYSVGKTFVTELNTDIENDCGKGNRVCTYREALKICKDRFSNSFSSIYSNNEPINPSKINDKLKFRIFKVKVAKSDIVLNTYNEMRTNQVEVVMEIILQAKYNYEVQSITEDENDGTFNFKFRVENDLTGNSLIVKFNTKNLPNQDKIKFIIEGRIQTMQKIYDLYQESNGELEVEKI